MPAKIIASERTFFALRVFRDSIVPNSGHPLTHDRGNEKCRAQINARCCRCNRPSCQEKGPVRAPALPPAAMTPKSRCSARCRTTQ
jgi:hypothetical protein